MENTERIEVKDYLEFLHTLPDGSVALLLSDPPYATTRNSWECELDMDAFFAEAWRILRPNGAIVMTTAEPFTSKVITHQQRHFRYCLYWDKRLPTGHLNAKRQPLRQIEPIVVLYRRQPTYQPQMTPDPRGKRTWHRKNESTGSYNEYGAHTYDSTAGKYPTSLLSFYQAPKGKLHPTEKPVELFRYLIETYTEPGDLVVDPFVGCGTTAIAAKLAGRSFAVSDLSEEYIGVAQTRLES